MMWREFLKLFAIGVMGGIAAVTAGVLGANQIYDALSPNLNTVTIHKQQDRVSIPCPDQGEGS